MLVSVTTVIRTKIFFLQGKGTIVVLQTAKPKGDKGGEYIMGTNFATYLSFSFQELKNSSLQEKCLGVIPQIARLSYLEYKDFVEKFKGEFQEGKFQEGK